MDEILGTTESLCPICLDRVEAFRIKEGNKVYMVKKCQKHGEFSTIIWSGLPEYGRWKRYKTPAYPSKTYTSVSKGCPYDCGLCQEHRQHT